MQMQEYRGAICWVLGILSGVLALLSIAAGLNWMSFPRLDHDHSGTLLVGLWAVLPPLAFWLDWMVLCSGMDRENRAIVEHTHDLSRNIWLAVVAILTVLFRIPMGGGG